MSTFMGLETSKRGLFTQQSALYTTGHNISNANTLGYSRQRVNMEATAGFPGVGLSAGTMPGFLGTGVQAGSIQRIRDTFVDQQFRQESTKLGFWESKTKAISQMEDVLNEPSAYGLQKSMSEFWQSLQDLSAKPENGGARAVVASRGEAIADSFNHIHKSLTEIQTNLGKEIGVTTGEVNSILQQITELNEQIAKVEPNGYMPNDLYDTRDVLVDQLSAILPIETSYEKSGGRALAIAEGTVTIKIKTDAGSIEILKGNYFAKMSVEPADQEGNPSGPVTGFEFAGAGNVAGWQLSVDGMLNSGTMKSLVNSFGYEENGVTKGLYPEMLEKIDVMANKFMDEFNRIHELGFTLPDQNGNSVNGVSFFEGTGASGMKVRQEILDDPGKVAASNEPGEEGNGKQALALGKMQFAPIMDDGSSIQTYYQGVIGKLGVDGRQAQNIALNSVTLLGAVENRRASISSVSLDEEMTDMIRFQQSYNASARMITVVDETLDKIINGMGVVGR